MVDARRGVRGHRVLAGDARRARGVVRRGGTSVQALAGGARRDGLVLAARNVLLPLLVSVLPHGARHARAAGEDGAPGLELEVRTFLDF